MKRSDITLLAKNLMRNCGSFQLSWNRPLTFIRDMSAYDYGKPVALQQTYITWSLYGVNGYLCSPEQQDVLKGLESLLVDGEFTATINGSFGTLQLSFAKGREDDFETTDCPVGSVHEISVSAYKPRLIYPEDHVIVP